jgi:hypothetical protein
MVDSFPDQACDNRQHAEQRQQMRVHGFRADQRVECGGNVQWKCVIRQIAGRAQCEERQPTPQEHCGQRAGGW